MKPAAFLRTDGLAPALEAGRVAGALTLRGRSLADKVWRTGAAWSSASLRQGGLLDADDAVRLAWLALRGTSEDRLAVVGEEVAEGLAEAVDRSPLAELVGRRRAMGDRVVLLSDLPECLARPLFAPLRPDALVANRLELRRGRLTGRLEEPLVASRLGGDRLRSWAASEGIDLARSTAYAARGDDLPLLASVGQPCAVQPDRALRAHARRLGWPLEVIR